MLKATFLLCILFTSAWCSSSLAGGNQLLASFDPAVVVDKKLAQECVAQALQGDEAGDSFVRQRLSRLDHQGIKHLTALVREELGEKALADAARVPPHGNLHAAWLLNHLGAESETLVYDLSIDGFFARRIGPGKRYHFQTFGKEKLVVRVNAATVGHEGNEKNMKAASRLFLRKIPGSEEYHVAAWLYLIKQRNSPPPPNPEGHYVPGLMKMRLPAVARPQ